MSRLWPSGITTRVVLILMLALLAIQAGSKLWYVRDRADAAIRVFTHSVAARIVAITGLMDPLTAAERARLIPALDSPTLRLTHDDGPPAWDGRAWRHPPPRLERIVRRHLGELDGRAIEIRLLGGWLEPWDRTGATDGPRVPDLLPSKHKLAIALPHPDGAWLVFTVASDVTSVRWIVRMLSWVMLSALFVLLFVWWATRRATRPLARFAEAADRLGVDVGAPPLPVAGAPELRKATAAFNRMQERIRRLVDDRTRMLAAISHDLRTALTRLRLRAEFIEDEVQQAKAIADLDAMSTMLDETLAFARDDAGGEARTEVDLGALVRSLCDDLAAAGQPARYTGPDHLRYACRPVALRRALANVVDNAIKYGEEARVALSETREGIELTVADRGPGIPPELQEQVFAPFFRLEPSRSRATGGAGLGLAVARTIIHRHGGQITLENQDGLIVRIALPHPSV